MTVNIDMSCPNPDCRREWYTTGTRELGYTYPREPECPSCGTVGEAVVVA